MSRGVSETPQQWPRLMIYFLPRRAFRVLKTYGVTTRTYCPRCKTSYKTPFYSSTAFPKTLCSSTVSVLNVRSGRGSGRHVSCSFSHYYDETLERDFAIPFHVRLSSEFLLECNDVSLFSVFGLGPKRVGCLLFCFNAVIFL